MASMLEEIVAAKREELARQKEAVPLEALVELSQRLAQPTI